ncbi:hypothetical protein NDU88_003626 [Pleurodeles waltl]|uniref:Uncharacterized protein n=1 Tax=Pleurodeles waltl TaxID=8319 RepID=A0AAV7VIC6_PLEWA|nr:hypothetical protein NDU88_003626 [Pleurodeles waltl]
MVGSFSISHYYENIVNVYLCILKLFSFRFCFTGNWKEVFTMQQFNPALCTERQRSDGDVFKDAVTGRSQSARTQHRLVLPLPPDAREPHDAGTNQTPRLALTLRPGSSNAGPKEEEKVASLGRDARI